MPPPPSDSRDCCKACLWFVPLSPSVELRGECHRYPAKIDNRPGMYRVGDDRARFPLVMSEDWCGEWKKR